MDRVRHATYSLRGQTRGGDVETFPIDRPTGELFELEDQSAMMVAAIRNNAPVACTGEDGRWSTLLCLAAQESVDTGHPVDLTTFAAR